MPSTDTRELVGELTMAMAEADTMLGWARVRYSVLRDLRDALLRSPVERGEGETLVRRAGDVYRAWHDGHAAGTDEAATGTVRLWQDSETRAWLYPDADLLASPPAPARELGTSFITDEARDEVAAPAQEPEERKRPRVPVAELSAAYDDAAADLDYMDEQRRRVRELAGAPQGLPRAEERENEDEGRWCGCGDGLTPEDTDGLCWICRSTPAFQGLPRAEERVRPFALDAVEQLISDGWRGPNESEDDNVSECADVVVDAICRALARPAAGSDAPQSWSQNRPTPAAGSEDAPKCRENYAEIMPGPGEEREAVQARTYNGGSNRGARLRVTSALSEYGLQVARSVLDIVEGARIMAALDGLNLETGYSDPEWDDLKRRMRSARDSLAALRGQGEG